MLLKYYRMQGFDPNAFNLSKSKLFLLRSKIDKYTLSDFSIFLFGKLPYIDKEGGVLFAFSSKPELAENNIAKRYDNDKDFKVEYENFISYCIENGGEIAYRGRINNYELS